MNQSTQEIVDGHYLRVCTPAMAYDWLAAQPREGFTRSPISLRSAKLETVLLERNDPLIDHGLARFGSCGEVASALYGRLDAEGRKVMRSCHRACGGPSDVFAGHDLNAPEAFSELSCWVTNPDIGDDLLVQAVTGTGLFEGLDDDHYQALLQWLGDNPRFAKRYVEKNLDGYDEYLWHKPLNAAWQLASAVPTTQAWATALGGLYQKMIPARGDLDVEAILLRWRIDEEPEDPSAWFTRSPSFYLRTYLARLQTDLNAQTDADDLAVRCAAYTTFLSYRPSDWSQFVERDGVFFFHYALENESIWRYEFSRQQLSRVAWSLPDPRSSMDHVNDYRFYERRWREKDPDLFEPDKEPTWAGKPGREELETSAVAAPPPAKLRSFFRFVG